MIVHVKNSGDPRLAQLVKLASVYYASKLLHKNMSKHIELDVELVDKLSVDGLSTWEDDYVRPREFSIVIRRDVDQDPAEKMRCHERILLTLAHEMVHVKQLARGELKERFGRGDKCVLWKNRKFASIFDSDDYWDLPWEIEAHGKEDGLLYRFVKHYNLFKEIGYDEEEVV